ncbi:hypothetical protein CGCSCA4_v005223 [Colletotrichum siamense]|uniref:Secreted protein n=5 Tax=Colletotrichum gloeosporioides species complex TaxID=2707338 RepID=L2FVK7_COLFN|nr:uncharacterized protein CGMCC3_g8988 [Colletotrichum fructicola]XP_036492355.1 uncharacterized protein CGCS363_v010482 [Colletotrichum siamense]XP_045258862.1 uncharacterized protein GCG54_00000947 [Colletotrichum gloeosporioides]EQB55674.1 hypothetical protein CGLO_04378 [Colletotrichum gloeosporioides Cg-14]KAF4479477.1 hypothetical protein CGGC5_v012862 [Colletotrichum fructicola Nara gc5]KAH9237455.1 hypothetical protein K456DRAFT_32964 [Colletotrichum gloeosporioides 23]KAI8167007.1 h
MQLPTLAAAGTLMLVALSKSVLACDGYLFCHCYNSDGKPNDAATQTVCNRYDTKLAKMIDANAWSDGAKECQYIGPEGARIGKYWHPYGYSNCQWREMCQAAGATGTDSSCRDTPPVGGKSYSAGVAFVPHS